MIRRLQVQLRAGQQTTAFTSTTDLAQTLGELAEDEGQKAQAGTEKEFHLARREAFLEALQVVLPA